MEGTDICFAPILTMAEAPKHPHMAARKIFVERHGVTQPAPAPRFSRTPSAIREPRTADIARLTKEWRENAVGWAKRSVPTMAADGIQDGGHGASALPTPQMLSFTVIPERAKREPGIQKLPRKIPGSTLRVAPE